MALAGEHRFGASAPLTLGVEEELLLVGAEHELVATAEATIERLEPDQRERVSTELFATQIELKTGVCADAAEAAGELETTRTALRAAGATMLGAGLHPAYAGRSQLVDKPRYAVVQEDLAGLIDEPPSGLHVHVGMPDPETAIAVANALRYHLPLLAALCANSPFRAGEDSGMASARAAVVRAYPRFEMPPEFGDYREFLRVADQLVLAAGVDDYTYLWWDVRPHPRLGTVEVRAMDVQPAVTTNAAVAALVQALAPGTDCAAARRGGPPARRTQTRVLPRSESRTASTSRSILIRRRSRRGPSSRAGCRPCSTRRHLGWRWLAGVGGGELAGRALQRG